LIPSGQDSLWLLRVAIRCLAPQQEGELKPQQPVIAHVDEKPVNQHNPCSQGPPDLASKNQQDQGTENDKEHSRHQVDEQQRIAHAGYPKKVQKHKGPPQGEGFRLFSTVPLQQLVFGPGAEPRFCDRHYPNRSPPFLKTNLLARSVLFTAI